MGSYPYVFLNLVYNFFTLDLKLSVLDMTYIRSLISLERSEIVVLFFYPSMYVVKLTDLILENKSVNGRFLRN